MISNRNSLLAAILFCIVSLSPSFTHAEVRVGNGGGAWVCYDNNTNDIRWMELVDLYEAPDAPLNLTIKTRTGTYEKIVDDVRKRLNTANPAFNTALNKNFEYVDYLHASAAGTPQNIIYTSKKLTVVDDSLHSTEPDEKTECKGGSVEYGQVVNFMEDGMIKVSDKLFKSPKFSETAKAALVFHEAIYKYRRDRGDKNSVITREIVGHIFSDLTDVELRDKLSSKYNVKYIAPYTVSKTTFTAPDFVDVFSKCEADIRTGRSMPGLVNNDCMAYKAYRKESIAVAATNKIKPITDTNNDQYVEHRFDKKFEVMNTEVTQEQWALLLGIIDFSGIYYETFSGLGCDYLNETIRDDIQTIDDHEQICLKRPVFATYDEIRTKFLTALNNNPSALGLSDKYIYRLPAVEEWDYTHRAGTNTGIFFGEWDGKEAGSNVEKYGRVWLGDENKKYSARQTAKVGSYLPNQWGIYDTLGNAEEITSTLIYAGFNTFRAATSGRTSCGGSVERGLSSAYKKGSWPDFACPTCQTGFRLVRELK